VPGNPKPKATIVRIDGSQEDLYQKPTLADLQRAVGGFVEYVGTTDIMGNQVKLAVDEDGNPKQKPVNKPIGELFGILITGNAVILYE